MNLFTGWHVFFAMVGVLVIGIVYLQIKGRIAKK